VLRRSLVLLGLLVAAVALAGCMGSGTYTVGQPGGVAPGLYRTAGSQAGPATCGWERRDPSGGLVAQFGSMGGPQYVQIEPTDGSFFSHFCQERLVASLVAPQATPGQPFGQGDFRVGYEVAPGTYTSPGNGGLPGPGCYWNRVSGFSHEVSDNLPSDPRLPGTQTVKILTTDFGFTSTNCGTWTKVG